MDLWMPSTPLAAELHEGKLLGDVAERARGHGVIHAAQGPQLQLSDGARLNPSASTGHRQTLVYNVTMEDMQNCTGTTGMGCTILVSMQGLQDGHFPRNHAVMREVWHPETWSTFVYLHMNLNPLQIFRVTYQVEDDQQSGSSQNL